MNEVQLEALLYEDESPTLDFKREQYPFQGEPDRVKAELLKDVLAFANSWRRSDAYILLGVDDVPGGRSLVVGVGSHLNDHDLQQFVNSKTQRPIEFSYSALTYEGKQVGVIRIPVQERPFYLRQSFGFLRKGAVYLRRGSSTDEAEPDEIARMGLASPHASEPPRLKLELASATERSLLGETAVVQPLALLMPRDDEIPDFVTSSSPFVTTFGGNRKYYRERAAYLRDYHRVRPVRFGVINVGDATAHDVRLEALIVSAPDLYVLDRRGLPEQPTRDFIISASLPDFRIPFNHDDVGVEQVPEGWRIVAEFGKCQPKQTVVTDDKLYLGSRSSREVELSARVFADQLPHPIESRLLVRVEVAERDVSLEELTS